MTTSDDEIARALHMAPGIPGSGRRRYGAAMALHAAGRLSDAALEVFRVLSPRDGDDPARFLPAGALPPRPAPRPQGALERLQRELLAILPGIPGPGIAETRAALAAATAGAPRASAVTSPVVDAHLPAALAALAEPALAAALAEAAPHLPWVSYADYPEAEIGPDFAGAHAFCTLVGEVDAVWAAEGVDIGLFLMAPQLFYRDHAHPAPELYLPLTGPHGWRFRPDAPLVAKPAFVPVWNAPLAPHATKVGAVPFLCLYAWLAQPQAPAHVVPAADWDRLAAQPLAALLDDPPPKHLEPHE